jgi:hypothetical protein
MAPRLSVRCTALLAAFAALAAAAPAPAAPVASSISLAASPNPASINGTVTVFGTLSESGGGGIAGKAIEIAVTPPGGSRTVRTTVTTGPIGQFSYADAIPFSVAGTYVYEAKWSGDATHAATTRTVAVAVLKQPATVSLTASPTVVDYNRQIAVTVGVGGAMSGTVSVYATPLGGVRTLVASGPVDASGTFRASLAMTHSALLVAEYSGSATHNPAASPGKIVQVRAISAARLRGGYGRAGRYRLYRAGASPRVIGTVIPAHPGALLMFTAQKRVAGAWRTLAVASFPIQPTGLVGAVLRRPSRGAWRVRASFSGDVDHLGDRSPWRYLKITR